MDRNNKKTQKGGLEFNVKKKGFNFKVNNLIILICVIIIAMMSALISSEYLITTYFSSTETIDISSDPKYNSNKQYSSLSKNLSSSIVTISDSEGKLIKHEFSDGNVTGIIVDNNGYVITNYSKIKDLDKVYIKLNVKSASIKEGKILGINEEYDIALLKIENNKTDLKAVTLYEDKSFIGDELLVIGNAISDDYIGTLIPGIITTFVNNYSIIQTNAIVNEDNTGGIICDLKGNVIGMASSEISKRYNKDGLYYGISSIKLKEIVDNIISEKNILGLIGESTNESEIVGIYVKEVKPNSISSDIGIEVTDIITKVDGKGVRNIMDIYYIISDKPKGSSVSISILRDGKEENIKLTI